MSALLAGTSLVFHEPLRRGTLTVLRLPFTILRTGVRILLTLPQLPSLTHENAALRSELIQQQAENAALRDALRKVEQTRALLDTSRSGHDGIIATVIGRSTIPMQHTLLLDKGERNGLTLDSVILDVEGLIGRVTELYPTTALVMLLTDPESRVAGIVERSRESGLLQGRGSGQCDFIYLDAQADIQEGDRIMTAGLGGPFPKGVLLGTVIRVIRDGQSGSASATVAPAAHLGRLEEVLCLSSQ